MRPRIRPGFFGDPPPRVQRKFGEERQFVVYTAGRAVYAPVLRFTLFFLRRYTLKRHALLVLALGFLMAADAKDDDIKKERKQTDGAWSLTSFITDGNKVAEEEVKKFKLTLEGDKYTLKQEDSVVSKGTTKIDPAKKPKTIDITPTEGDNKGQVMLGIYEINGDTYKVCYTPTGDRPTKFAAEAGSGHFLLVFKKDKP
jgi:uncharacterized protein (TIGR03067 family)